MWGRDVSEKLGYSTLSSLLAPTVAGTRQEAGCCPRWIVGFSEKCCSSPDPRLQATTCCHANISPLLLSHGFICFEKIEFAHKMAICLPNWVHCALCSCVFRALAESSEDSRSSLPELFLPPLHSAQCRVNTLALSPLPFHSSPSPPPL